VPDIPPEISELLAKWETGDKEAFRALFPLIYKDLRRLAHHHSAVDGDVMRKAVSFARGPVAGEREYRALSDEVRGRIVLVQVGENRRKRFARMQLLRGHWISGVHEHHRSVCPR
jgi:hypothetical protein